MTPNHLGSSVACAGKSILTSTVIGAVTVVLAFLSGCNQVSRARDESSAKPTPAIMGDVTGESLYVFGEEGFQWSLRYMSIQTHVPFTPGAASRGRDSQWSVQLRYDLTDSLRRRSFRPVGEVVLTELKDSDGRDLLDQAGTHEIQRGNDANSTQRNFPVLWEGPKQRHSGNETWPPRFEGSINLGMSRLPARIALLRGYFDIEVAAKSRFVEVSVDELREWKEIVPGVRFRVELPAESARSREMALDYECPMDNFEALDAINAMLVIDDKGNQIPVNFRRMEQELEGVVRGSQSAMSMSGSTPTKFRFHLVEQTKQVRIPFAVKDLELYEFNRLKRK